MKLDCWPYQPTDLGHLYLTEMGNNNNNNFSATWQVPGYVLICSSNETISGTELHLKQLSS